VEQKSGSGLGSTAPRGVLAPSHTGQKKAQMSEPQTARAENGNGSKRQQEGGMGGGGGDEALVLRGQGG